MDDGGGLGRPGEAPPALSRRRRGRPPGGSLEHRKKLRGNVLVNQQRFLGVADAGAAGLGVFHDVHRHFQVSGFVHVDVADAGAGLRCRAPSRSQHRRGSAPRRRGESANRPGRRQSSARRRWRGRCPTAGFTAHSGRRAVAQARAQGLHDGVAAGARRRGRSAKRRRCPLLIARAAASLVTLGRLS